MDLADLIFTSGWGVVAVLALVGVREHWRQQCRYGAGLRSGRLSREASVVVVGWRRDERFRCGIKAFLCLVACGWFMLNLWVDLPNTPSSVLFRTFGLTGVGGATILLTAWRVQVDQERRERRPDIETVLP